MQQGFRIDHVISVVVSIVNYLRTRKLKHRLFKSFLEEADSEYGDAVYHTDVRWLSCAKVLKRFIALKNEIKKFLETEPQDFSELNDSSWNENLFFLCDITSHSNDLNIKLQGKGKLVFDLLDAVNGFRVKLRLFKCQFLKGMLTHFLICSQHISLVRHLAAGMKYAAQIELLIEEFNNRLTLSSEEKLHLKIIETTFQLIRKKHLFIYKWNLSICRLHLYTKVNIKKAVCKTFTSASTKKNLRIYLLWQNKCSAYLGAVIYVNKRSQ